MLVPSRLVAVAEDVARAHGITLEELRAKDRNKSLVVVRRAVARALREAGASFPEAGRVMHRDHSTVMNLVKVKCEPLAPEERFRVA